MVIDMALTRISVAQQFSPYPAGRYYDDGPNSGQRFREEHLLPALKSGEEVVVDLDGTLGYGSSFLEEAFGGLVREHGFRLSQLKQLLRLECSVEAYVNRVWQYIVEADARLKH